MRHSICLLLFVALLACKNQKIQESTSFPSWTPYDESEEITANAEHPTERMRYKLIQSKILNRNAINAVIKPQLAGFSSVDYEALKPLILEQDIPRLQAHIQAGKLSYEHLVQWYLYRILTFENDRHKTLHSIISINPNAVAQARKCDTQRSASQHPIYGMPILLKDNINTEAMPTTAGAHALLHNQTSDAFITKRIKAKGGIILGKANLSEWAYFFCRGCPVGYSAVGGQTLNPYGRKIFESGGSSSGSGATMAANYAVAAVGTETSGSILSPSSMNSVVGLKPTIGLLSRTGIVPISSSLDTPGPMTRNTTDNAILLSAMLGEDVADTSTLEHSIADDSYWKNLKKGTLEGLRLGVNKAFLEEPIYAKAIQQLQELGAETIEFEAGKMNFEGFLSFLNADMKVDLPNYLAQHANQDIPFQNVADIVAHNLKDTLVRMPYGQMLFEGIVAEDISAEGFAALKARFHKDARDFFETPMQAQQLDAVLSINNWNAGHAAMAKYPCLTVPMGYKDSGEPIGLTFIARAFEEAKLLQMGYAFEQATKARQLPKGYE